MTNLLTLFFCSFHALTHARSYEATRDLNTKDIEVRTPVAVAKGQKLSSKVALVPILRSGLGMVESMQNLLPFAFVHHLGMYRTKQSMVPVLYYDNIPRHSNADVTIILEPVIATSKTIKAAISILKSSKFGDKIKIVSLIASREGLEEVTAAHPDVEVYCAAVDENLKGGFISPGLGDVGDRLFGTGVTPKEGDGEDAAGDATENRKRPRQ